MNKNILNYIEECEGWKVGIKNLHWSADNMSQHELCDDIADEISNFEDLVSEIEQSISGKIKLNGFTPKSYKITSLKSFVEDVISASKSFLKELEGMGEKYIGIKSECETFIGTMQRKLYLVNFTLKEELKKRLRDKINESRPKNLANTVDVDKFMGRRPKTVKARINQIYRIVKKYGIDSRKYHDEAWQAIDDYYRAITSLGCEVELKPCGHLNNADSMESDGGYCDYAEDGMPRSKQYSIKIMFEDGMAIDGYIKCMAAGTVSDPFASYDTCMVLWPKQNNVLESKNINKQMSLTEAELKQVVKEAAMKILSETQLNFDVDNFSGRWNKNEPSDEEWALADSAANGDYLDNPFNPPNSWDDDEWIDGDKDMENDYSWDLYHRMNNVGKSPVDRQHDIMDAAQNRRDHAAYWTDRDNERGNRLMNKWVDGKRDLDDLEDADFSYDPYKYNESKNPTKTINEVGDTYGNNKSGAYKIGKLAARQDWRDKEPQKSAKTLSFALKSSPKDSDGFDKWSKTVKAGYSDGKQQFKVTEAELKQVVKEATISLIQEYTQKQSNTKGFIKSTHGHRSQPKRKQKQAKGSFGEREKKLLKQMGKEVDESSDIEIKPENKGKFNATKKATGKSTEELTHSKNPLTRKRAIFAQNAKKWSHKKS